MKAPNSKHLPPPERLRAGRPNFKKVPIIQIRKKSVWVFKIGICGLIGICLPVGREFVIWDFRYHMLYAFRS
jgi:hypothetical protein